MNAMKSLGILAFLILLSGCVMNLEVDQTVNEDGSSYVVQTMDLSTFMTYMASLQGQIGALQTAPEPDDSYFPEVYSSLPTPESQGLALTQNDYYLGSTFGSAYENAGERRGGE